MRIWMACAAVLAATPATADDGCPPLAWLPSPTPGQAVEFDALIDPTSGVPSQPNVSVFVIKAVHGRTVVYDEFRRPPPGQPYADTLLRKVDAIYGILPTAYVGQDGSAAMSRTFNGDASNQLEGLERPGQQAELPFREVVEGQERSGVAVVTYIGCEDVGGGGDFAKARSYEVVMREEGVSGARTRYYLSVRRGFPVRIDLVETGFVVSARARRFTDD